uniref:Major facilitator superfamily (MFS) profile domain-containing protein n=1 Tax=Timema bartmani TaxID=61472 RepID=A0A7R9F6P2_9NEOP|nr:unnamed protein product [Timema bartmani]
MFYVGMICSSHMWGYLADTYGRKKVLVCGMLMDSICSFFGSFSHALWLYLIVRFFNGALICPNSNVLFAYLGEFHSSSTRTRAIIFLNISIMLGATILPGLAWLIIPQTWAWELPWITYRSWRLFVIVTALPGLITVLYMGRVLPESPKYLLATGRSQEALDILRRIYADNSGEPPESYPVLSVTIDGSVSELPSPLGLGKKNSALDVMKSIWRQTAPLFVPPHLRNTTIACLFMFSVYACSNSLSLWIPDMFNNLGVYYNLHPEGPSRLCEAIGSSSANMTAPILPSLLEVIYSDLLEEPSCVIQITSQTFINPMIFGVIAGVIFIPMGFVINKLGKKNTMYMCVLVATSGAIGLYFVVTPIWAITLASMYNSFIFATVGALNSIVIDIFPTHLRAMAVSLTLMVGRIGTICGSILLAALLELSCDSIFFVFAGTALDLTLQKEELTRTLRAVVISSPQPRQMTLEDVERDYKRLVGKDIPHFKFGYETLLDLLNSIPQDFQVIHDESGKITVKASVNNKSEHIEHLIKNQRVNTTTENPHRKITSVELQLKLHRKVFVPHEIQHSLYKFVKDRHQGVELTELQTLLKNGQTLLEFGLDCGTRGLLEKYLNHILYLRNNTVFPADLHNSQGMEGPTPPTSGAKMRGGGGVAEILTEVWVIDRQMLVVRTAEGTSAEEFGSHFDYTHWGYMSIFEMVRHMPEIFHCVKKSASEWFFFDARRPIPRTLVAEAVCAGFGVELWNSKYGDLNHRDVEANERKTATSLQNGWSTCSLNGYIRNGSLDESEGSFPLREVLVACSCEAEKSLCSDFDFYDECGSNYQIEDHALRQRLFCAANCEGRFLRSRVISFNSSNLVKIWLVDYGILRRVARSDLRYFHPAFARFPTQAFVGRLANVSPINVSGWSREGCAVFRNHVIMRPITAIVTNADTKDRILTATLMRVEDDGGRESILYIDDKLVSLGLATYHESADIDV